MREVLTPAQVAVADRVLAEEEARRRHLVVSLSGAHAYGFPSPDSDLDLKAIHVAPTAALLGLSRPAESADRLEVVDGVEVDYTSNEVGPVLVGLLQGNGNYLERVLSAYVLRGSPELEALVPLVQRSLSRRVYRHYAGFARGQLREWEKSGFASAKRLLYVLRTLLTGTHVLATGEVETDVTRLLPRYGQEAAEELVEQKRRGERALLPQPLAEAWRERVGQLFWLLEEAYATSRLPDAPPNVDALEAWLLELRRTRL